MSVRLYIGNLPQNFETKELEAQLKSIGEGIRFKAVMDRDTGACRGFGFANVDKEKTAEKVISELNGVDFQGNKLRVERSEKKDSNSGGRRGNNGGSNNSSQGSSRKETKKFVHSDAPSTEAPDPRWGDELAKLKDLLANQKTAV